MGTGETDGVAGQRCEIGEQGLEAVDGQTVVGAFGPGLARGGGRRLSLGDRRGSQSLARGAIVVVEHHGRERLAHVPFEIVGEHAQEDMGADAIAGIVEDRPDFEIDRLGAAEGPLDMGQAFVGGDLLRLVCST